MSRSSWSLRFSRPRRANSFRSALLRPGSTSRRPTCLSAAATPALTDCAVGSNSSVRSSTDRRARAKSTIDGGTQAKMADAFWESGAPLAKTSGRRPNRVNSDPSPCPACTMATKQWHAVSDAPGRCSPVYPHAERQCSESRSLNAVAAVHGHRQSPHNQPRRRRRRTPPRHAQPASTHRRRIGRIAVPKRFKRTLLDLLHQLAILPAPNGRKRAAPHTIIHRETVSLTCQTPVDLVPNK